MKTTNKINSFANVEFLFYSLYPFSNITIYIDLSKNVKKILIKIYSLKII